MAKKDYSSSNRSSDFSSPNRRKFLIGAGSLAAGGSALLGTAATTTFNLNDRGVSANVVTDSSGAVALTDKEQGDIINLTDSNGTLGSGELEVDFSPESGSAEGVNLGSIVTVGNFSDPSSDSAFTITNQTTDEVDVDIQFEADATDFVTNTSGSTLEFRIDNVDSTTTAETSDTLTAGPGLNAGGTVTSSFNNGGTNGALPSGSKLDVAIRIDADNSGSTQAEDLSGVLNITATQG